MTTDSRPLMLLRAVLVLVAGFAVIDLPPFRACFEALAQAIAAIAAALLRLAGYSILRNGSELRDTVAGWGLEVTRVCDGHGLLIALLALAAARGGRRFLWVVLAGGLAIQLFNLARVVVLAGVLDRAPAEFETVHIEVFPLLTAALMLLLAALALRLSGRRVGLALAGLAPLAVVWIGYGATLLAPLLVPAANALLALAAPAVLGPIAVRPGGWVVETALVAGRAPLSLHVVPIHPADFAIALPVLLAALLASRGRGAGLLALGLGLMVLALALGAVTEAWAATDSLASEALRKLGGNHATLVPYSPPAAAWQTLVRLVQNVLVHFNLLVLPGLMLLPPRQTLGATA